MHGVDESVQLEVRKLEGKMKSFLAESSIHKIVQVNAIASLGLPNVCRGSLHTRPLKAMMKPQPLFLQLESRYNVG